METHDTFVAYHHSEETVEKYAITELYFEHVPSIKVVFKEKASITITAHEKNHLYELLNDQRSNTPQS